MAPLSRNSSRGNLSRWEDTSGFLGPPLGGVGCTCGAGELLEAERRRLEARSRVVASRGDCVAQREAEIDDRARGVEAGHLAAQRAEVDVRQRRAAARGELQEVDRQLREVSQREETVKRWEDELEQQIAVLRQLETQAAEREDAVAREELSLLEVRNLVEDELSQLSRQLAAVEAEAAALDRQRAAFYRQLQEAEEELKVLDGDDKLLTEIEAQVAPIRRRLDERERRLAAEEIDMRAREADCDEREACLLPEYAAATEALSLAEQRFRDLRDREEESLRQRQRLLQRQRDLGGTEIRLNSFEGALQRQGGALPAPVSRGGAPRDVEDMNSRLVRLRRADAEWNGKVQVQQCEVQRLEALVEQLEARLHLEDDRLTKPAQGQKVTQNKVDSRRLAPQQWVKTAHAQ